MSKQEPTLVGGHMFTTILKDISEMTGIPPESAGKLFDDNYQGPSVKIDKFKCRNCGEWWFPEGQTKCPCRD